MVCSSDLRLMAQAKNVCLRRKETLSSVVICFLLLQHRHGVCARLFSDGNIAPVITIKTAWLLDISLQMILSVVCVDQFLVVFSL